MDYHLKPIGKTCEATGEELVAGTVVHSVVLERGGELVRLDYSADAWSGPPPEAIGHWQSIVPEPEVAKNKPLDADALMGYFEQMVEDANPTREKLQYVLALLLLQKRRLRLEDGPSDPDEPQLHLVGNHGEGPFTIPDQQLDESEIEQLQNDLNFHLHSEWN